MSILQFKMKKQTQNDKCIQIFPRNAFFKYNSMLQTIEKDINYCFRVFFCLFGCVVCVKTVYAKENFTFAALV